MMDQAAQRQYQRSPGGTVLLVHDELEYLASYRGALEAMGLSVQACDSYAEGIRQLKAGTFDMVIVGQGSREFEGRTVLASATDSDRSLPVVVVARHLDVKCYLEAMQLGAVDYFAEPFVAVEFDRVLKAHARNRKSRTRSHGPEPLASGPVPEGHAG